MSITLIKRGVSADRIAAATSAEIAAAGDLATESLQGMMSNTDKIRLDNLIGLNLGQVVTVAQSGGNFTSIQSAINSITDAGSSKPYVILVFPGFYTEALTCKDFVHIFGFGSVEYSNSCVVVQNPNNVVTTANCNITGIRFNLQGGDSSGSVRLINGAGTGTTFRCTFNNCYFVVNGNFGSNTVKLCENSGTSDIYFINSGVFYAPTSSTGCICFDSINGTVNIINVYISTFSPSGSTTLIFWRKQFSGAVDEIHGVFFKAVSGDSNFILFKNTSTSNIIGNSVHALQQGFLAGTFSSVTSSGLVLINGGEILGFRSGLVTKSGSYSIAGFDHKVLVDVSGGVSAITLPTAVGIIGKEFIVKDWKGNAASNNITIGTTGGQTIDGASSKVISSNYGSVKFVSDGANWSVM